MNDVSTIEYFPNEIFRDKNGTVTIGDAQAILAGATANQNIIGAVTGKIIRVISMYLVANGAAAATGTLTDGSGGTAHFNISLPPNTAAMPPFGFNPAGWVETSSGVGLYASIGSVTGVLVSMRYIVYTA